MSKMGGDHLRNCMMRFLAVLSLIALTGCFQAYSEDDGLNTVPVTNNPHIVPNTGGGFPGMGGS